jgi:DNA modification methylase
MELRYFLEMAIEQLSIFKVTRVSRENYREKLITLLSENLDFHGQGNVYKSHNFHSFPAKFPPQLPRKFINGLTDENEVVLDPMAGSGTTILEALIARRQGLGFDIDPLALKISTVKLTPLDLNIVIETGKKILENARAAYAEDRGDLLETLKTKWDAKTREFVDYWFAEETQIELLALINQIQGITAPSLRGFFELVFSAVIITKSGGVSLALDLAHTRPHKAKLIINKSGEIITGKEIENNDRSAFLTKTLRSAFDEFEKRFKNNLDGLFISTPKSIVAKVSFGNAESLPLLGNSIDLIVTSPPYASNAIDYMRAHKFSLVWMGFSIDGLSEKRKEYIGSESTENINFEKMPPFTESLLARLAQTDYKKSAVVRRYYSEMTCVIKEMYRVLKPGKAAIVVVGNSVIRGIGTETQACLAEIGKTIGFEVPKIGVRNLDRNRRMLPAGLIIDTSSQIQQRMHQEYVIGYFKP